MDHNTWLHDRQKEQARLPVRLRNAISAGFRRGIDTGKQAPGAHYIHQPLGYLKIIGAARASGAAYANGDMASARAHIDNARLFAGRYSVMR